MTPEQHEGRPTTTSETASETSDTSSIPGAFDFQLDFVLKDSRGPTPSGSPPAPVAIDTSTRARSYAEKTINGVAAAVAQTPEGSRNDALNVNALRAYRVADAAGVDRQTVTEAMTNAGQACGLDNAEIAATLRSAAAGADKHGPAPIPASQTAGDSTDVGHLAETGENEPPDGPPVMAAHLLNTSALQALPDPEPLIIDTLDQGTVALLYGKWGTYKSFLALDWAASVATARPWQGRATERRRTLYVAAEGAYGLKARLAAWQSGWRTTIGDDDLSILPVPANLTNNNDVAALLDLIAWGGYGFVVLDTLARCMVGGDENSAKDCGVVVDNMVRLRRATPGGRGVVLGVHHTGKDGKTFRGSSAFEAGADTVYSMTRDGGAVTLNREKRKDGPELDQHELSLDLIDGTASGVLKRFHQGGGTTERQDPLLSTFHHHFSTTGATGTDLRGVADMSTGTFYRALNDLLERGALKNHGTDKRPFYRAA